MTQGVLKFQYEQEQNESGMTALAGLPVYLELAQRSGLIESIRRHMVVRAGTQGWRDDQVVMSLLLLNLAGGDCVEDLSGLEGDEGFSRVLRRVEIHGMSRKIRREMDRRWRKGRRRSVPSPSSVFRYLGAFHDEEQEKLRESGRAFIPEPNQYLRGMRFVNRDLVAYSQRCQLEKDATLDMDATLVETSKKSALYCYKHFQSYQPLNTWWYERGMVLHTEFRDGNVPAGYQQLRVLEESLESLPEGIKRVWLRSDSAGYQQDLLEYCAEGKNERFGVIEFAIAADVTSAFKKAVKELKEEDWRPLYRKVGGEKKDTGQEWAEVCFVPTWVSHSKKNPDYRYIAIREPLRQLELPVLGSQGGLPFPTMDFGSSAYKLFGVVTNRDLPGDELIWWMRQRCGKSEEAHAVMKEDLAGGQLPSNDFGVNAAWWWIMVLALNLNSLMKSLVLPVSWISKRMKAIRFALINLPGRVLSRSRQIFIRLGRGHPSFHILVEARQRIAGLVPAPSG